MQIFDYLKCLACVLLALAFGVNAGVAAGKNYSGKYSLQVQRHASGNNAGSTIEVVQNEDSIDVTRVEQGTRTSNRYPLNGGDGDYTSSGGVRGKCKAQLKDKYLVLESVVAATPEPNAPPMRVHTKERWQLSADAKTLTVKSDMDFPDAPSRVSAVVGESASGTQKYARTESQ